MSKTVELKGPDGQVLAFDRADAEQMMKDGWHPPDSVASVASEYPVTAGILGAARGATFGFSDILAKKLGADPEAIRALQEANPKASVAGEIAGSMVPFGAGTGALEGLTGLARVPAAIVTGGVTGALGGAGETVAGSYLDNVPLRGEELAVNALKGAGMGLAGAAAGEGLAAAVGKGVKTLAKLAPASGAASDIAAETAAAKLASKNDILRFDKTPGRMAELGHQLIESGALKGGAKEAIEANTSRLKELGQLMEDFHTNSVSNVAPDTVTDIVGKMREFSTPTDFDITTPPWMKKLRLMADKVEAKAGVNAEDLTTRDLHEFRKATDRLLDSYNPITNPAPKALVQARGAVNAALHQSMPEEFQNISLEYGAKKDLGKLLEAARVNEAKGGPDAAESLKQALPTISLAAGGLHLGAILHHPATAAAAVAGALVPAVGSYLRAAVEKIGASATIQNAAKASFDGAAKSVDALLSSGAKTAVMPNLDDYGNAVAKIQDLAKDPQVTAARATDAVGQDVHNRMPQIADAATQKVLQGLQELHQAIPQPPNQRALLSTGWSPTKSQQAEWMAAYQAVMDPHAAMANPTPAGMAMVRRVYPELAQQFQNNVLTQLQDKTVPYQTQLKLSKLLGQDVSTLTNPALVQTAQQVLGSPALSGDNQKGSARTVASSRAAARKLDFKATVKSEQTQVSKFLEK